MPTSTTAARCTSRESRSRTACTGCWSPDGSAELRRDAPDRQRRDAAGQLDRGVDEVLEIGGVDRSEGVAVGVVLGVAGGRPYERHARLLEPRDVRAEAALDGHRRARGEGEPEHL